MREAIRQTDFEELGKAAHSLKGSCAYIGAERMATLSIEMEVKGRERSKENVDLILTRLEAEFAQIRSSVEAGLLPYSTD